MCILWGECLMSQLEWMERTCDICSEEFSTSSAMKKHKKMHDNASRVFKEVILEPKPKCKYGDCDHIESEHEAGVCWHIVKPELTDVPDDNKFCGCHGVANLSHSWEIKETRNPIGGEGWQDPKIGTDDACIMITKPCKVCKRLFLIRVDTDTCTSCSK